VLLDLGTGAFANLRETLDYTEIDGIVVSHMHADHFLDVIPLRYALKYGPLLRSERMPLYLPPGGEKTLRKMCDALAREDNSDFLDCVFEVHEYNPSGALEIGDLRLTFAKTIHYIDAYACRAEHAGASIVYSADTAPSKAVAALVRGCGLFICEATLGLGSEDSASRGHLSAREAGEMAEEAGVHRLLLTHYGSEVAPRELEDAATTVYHGPCAVADDGTELTV
jgi:ribonuclease BN (tRNA processing enzyme)